MVNYRYIDAENEVLRMRLKEHKEVAVTLKALVGKGGYFSKAKAEEIQEKLNEIIRCTKV